MNRRHHPFVSLLAKVLTWLLACAGSAALAQADPPSRAGSLSQIQGTVVLAPSGDTEWRNAGLNRPVTRGDRLWTDQGSRAEVHLGTAVLHLDDETFLESVTLDRDKFKASLHEGTVDARVRELARDDLFEIDTPNLAFRALQPGDYRIAVDPSRSTTQVSVRSGSAVVYGADGRGQQLLAGQQLAFTARLLEPSAVAARGSRDGFDRWAAERNWREDQSIAANFVSRDVVGYSQLDAGGAWVQDATHGAVWYPELSVPDWAPYRYGRWEWIKPWGWTWIDDAPWGFAPFHYGRWAMIGTRWAWVPGRLAPRPVYAPALVAFLGNGSGSASSAAGPGVAWYPLAPGEAWQPGFHASANYLKQVNRSMSVRSGVHSHQRRPEAVTALRSDDFTRGGAVQQHWHGSNPTELARVPGVVPPGRSQALPPPQAESSVPGPMPIPQATLWSYEAQREQQRMERRQPLELWQRMR